MRLKKSMSCSTKEAKNGKLEHTLVDSLKGLGKKKKERTKNTTKTKKKQKQKEKKKKKGAEIRQAVGVTKTELVTGSMQTYMHTVTRLTFH